MTDIKIDHGKMSISNFNMFSIKNRLPYLPLIHPNTAMTVKITSMHAGHHAR